MVMCGRNRKIEVIITEVRSGAKSAGDVDVSLLRILGVLHHDR